MIRRIVAALSDAVTCVPRTTTEPLRRVDAAFVLLVPSTAVAGIAVEWIFNDRLAGDRMLVTVVGLSLFPLFGSLAAVALMEGWRHARSTVTATSILLTFLFQVRFPSLRPLVPLGYGIAAAYATAWAGARLGMSVGGLSIPLTLVAQKLRPVDADANTAFVVLFGLIIAATALLVAAAAKQELVTMGRSVSLEISGFTHDVRTLLGAIQGFAETLTNRWKDLDEGTRNDFLDRISSNAAELLQMCADSLDLSRAIGVHEIKPVSLVLRDVVNDYVHREAPAIPDHLVRYEIPATLRVMADQSALLRILDNLIRNAAKFSPAGSDIVVVGTWLEGHALVTVTDEGIGMPDSIQDHIFDLYFRGSPGSHGAGVGLALVRRFVELHEGRVWVHSEPGRGTTVGFTLPTPNIIAAGGSGGSNNRLESYWRERQSGMIPITRLGGTSPGIS